jgi:hypothetical protein
MQVVGWVIALGLAVSAPVAAAPSATLTDDLHRPLHLPRVAPGKRCPISPSRVAPWGSQQRLNGRGPAYLAGVGGAAGATISISLSARDSSGWYGQKTPWIVERSYDGPILVRGARIGRRGEVRFAHSDGDHLRELFWESGADAGLPPNPDFRFLPSATLFRGAGCYAFQVDGTSFSRVIVARVRR